MPRKQVPSYRLHKPSGKAVVTLDGRDFYLGLWNTQASRAEYDRLVAEWLANGRRRPGRDRFAALAGTAVITTPAATGSSRST